MVNRDYLLQSFAESGRTYSASAICPTAALMPLTSDAEALKSRIEAFEFDGGTAGHIGVQWAWYMLSPNWASLLPEPQKPMGYDSSKVGKFAILMTDGLFNLSYFDASQVPNPNGVYQDGKAPPRDAAIKLCDGMKAKGIEIYTIGFDLYNKGIPEASRKQAIDLLKGCASPENTGKHFFDASTGPELKAAFEKIAQNLNRLALTK